MAGAVATREDGAHLKKYAKGIEPPFAVCPLKPAARA
jgi:hypothetical protein